jgi:hypothetical protein
MRKLTSALGAAALMVGSLGLTATPAFADTNASQICSKYNNFGVSHGECVSSFESSRSTVEFCKSFQEQNPYHFDLYFKNLGECVSTINQYKL